MERTGNWNAPVDTLDSKHIFWVSRFTHQFGLGFFNGVFLENPYGVLENAQEGKTKATRHWKFKSYAEIVENTVVACMNETLKNQKKGLEFQYEY